MRNKIAIFWFRRDLRLEDNIGLYHALNGELKILPIFIFDTEILEKLENKNDRRIDYIHQALTTINYQLKQQQSALTTFKGKPFEIFQLLLEKYDIQAVYCNRDYEPQAITRDTTIFNYFKQKGIPFRAYKDQVIFDKSDILKNDGTPYTIYTPYAKKWKETLQKAELQAVKINLNNIIQQDFSDILSLEKIGFKKTDITFDAPVLNIKTIINYDRYRDFPALQQTTHLSIALRFGTISIRQCVVYALKHNYTWLSELIWREFFMQILYHFPKVVQQCFKSKYNQITWRNNEEEFKRWCEGTTGYPIVDAGMRQLNQTGFMHNRVRMITASFLCKHLLIDWRWGETYFAEKLNDYDLSANNGNWQWAAGCGCDAAPYFRVFNPTLQTEKFDRDHMYIRKWIPEFESGLYPEPMVEHKVARERALIVYNKALK